MKIFLDNIAGFFFGIGLVTLVGAYVYDFFKNFFSGKKIVRKKPFGLKVFSYSSDISTLPRKKKLVIFIAASCVLIGFILGIFLIYT